MKTTLLKYIALIAMGLSVTACNVSGNSDKDPVDTNTDITAPSVIQNWPANLATGVVINRDISATFSELMNAASINSNTLTLIKGMNVVAGTVKYEGTTATFNPTVDLEINTQYIMRISVDVMDVAGNHMVPVKTWTFTTGSGIAAGPAPVELGTAGSFAILSKSGVATVPSSVITGDIGVSPAAATYLTGFSLTMDSTNTFSTSSQITGKAYAADYAPPIPAKMTTAVSDMEIAYTNAAGRSGPDVTELAAGAISGLTLVPGLYKWGTGLLISNEITLNGSADDVWIFQISGDLTVASGAKIILTGGALASNIFWQSSGVVVVNTTAHVEGIVLCQTKITLATGASANGRLLAQTAVTLDQSTVTQPAF